MLELFIFAHQDDEYAVAARLARERRAGHDVYCVYLTNGAAGGVSAETRDAESLRALSKLGIDQGNVFFLGSRLCIDDGQLVRHLEQSYRALIAWVIETLAIRPDLIYCLAWEGGHQDHDASHLVALAVAQHLEARTALRQAPFYHGFGTPGRFFRTLTPLDTMAEIERRRLSWREAWKNAFLCLTYRSQARTWIGLFPQSFINLVLRRTERVGAVDPKRIQERPHPGPLLYERMGRMSFEEFMKCSRSFREDIAADRFVH